MRRCAGGLLRVSALGVEGAFDAEDAATGDMGVAFCGAEVAVAKEGLNVADIGAGFEEVGGESVAQTVD